MHAVSKPTIEIFDYSFNYFNDLEPAPFKVIVLVQWASDWQHDLRPCMTLDCPSSRLFKLHVKYFKNSDRYHDRVSRS